MIIHNLTNFHQNWMLSSPLIVFTDKVTDTQTHRQTKVITIPHHKICEGVKKKNKKKTKNQTNKKISLRNVDNEQIQ